MSKLPKRKRTLSGELSERFRTLDAESRRAPSLAGTGLEVVDPGGGGTTGSVRIPAGGQLLIDGGDLIALDTGGAVLLRIGVQEFGDRGITIRRSDGSTALDVRDVFGGGDQSILLYDRAGKIIGGESVLSGSGFDAPHQDLRFIPVNYDSSNNAQATSSGTFAALHEHRGFRQNPALDAQFMVKCSDGTTAAELQVYDVTAAAYLGGFLGSPATLTISVPTGTTAYAMFEFASPLALPGLMSDAMHLQIHARVTAGAGSVTVAPVRTVGSGF